MSRPSADRGRSRVALVGAMTPEGASLRAVLARRGIASGRVELFAGATGTAPNGGAAVAGLISEYAGEARLVQEPDLDRIAAHEVIFLCEVGPLANRLAGSPPAGAPVVDLVAAAERSAAGDGAGRLVPVPHPFTLVLAEVLGPLHHEFDVAEAIAVLALPAAEYGEAGVDELRQQVVSLLNFSEPPAGRFGRRLAFDVLPASVVGDAAPVESRVARELRALLDWPDGRLALSRLIVPVFHGLGVQLRVRLSARPSREAVAGALSSLVPPGPRRPVTPAGAEEAGGLTVAGVAGDGIGGFWLWVVAADPAPRAAELALRLAAEHATL